MTYTFLIFFNIFNFRRVAVIDIMGILTFFDFVSVFMKALLL